MSDSPKKILIVEGNASLAKMIQSGLEQAGYEVAAVENGRDAWDKIGDGFDALITDHGMTDSVGASLCNGIRQHRKHKQMPMVVLSGERGADLAKLKDEFDLVAAFKKPLSVSELVAAVNAHFGVGPAPDAAAADEPAPVEEAPAAEAEAPAAEEPAQEPAADEAPAQEPAEEPAASDEPASDPEQPQ